MNFTVAALAYRDFGVVAVWLLAIAITILAELWFDSERNK